MFKGGGVLTYITCILNDLCMPLPFPFKSIMVAEYYKHLLNTVQSFTTPVLFMTPIISFEQTYGSVTKNSTQEALISRQLDYIGLRFFILIITFLLGLH